MILITGVTINLTVLFYFKYFDFFVENMNADIATERNGYFISEVANISDRIIELLGNKLNDKRR